MYVVNETQYQQFDERNIMFSRVTLDPTCPCYGHTIEENVEEILKERKPGYSRVDLALYEAAWTVHDTYEGAFSWDQLRPPGAKPELDRLPRYEITDPAVVSAQIKRAAHFYGASLVGITKIDRRWVYSHNRNGTQIKIPDHFTYAIVMGIAMDPVGIGTTPAFPSSAAAAIAYSEMAFLAASLGEFIRNLGYNAIQMGNDTALSIPLAIDAGLGELGRHGLLITPQYGSRVRICKVFTDLPLICDHPIEFGVQEFCRTCKLCAEECEVEAISFDEEPTFEPVCISNNPGVLKWPIDAEKCYDFWCENGGDCATCIAVCPYTKRTGVKKVLPEEFWKPRNEPVEYHDNKRSAKT
jgi:epoxyqueuosine reductase